ncbi:flagellar brake protein [Lentibacillus salinarum]|uniref:Flagellar brake protein n=1 Tax=Lentibacillus salinarum TaxID=446820 RepID=A0ABW3ZQE6_9BACI
MKIGTLLTLDVNNPETGKTQQYRSRVIGENAHALFIDLPIDNETNKTAFFAEGTPFKVIYIGQDQAVHMFHTEINSKAEGNVPALAIRPPEKEAIQTIQRRQYVRVNTAVDVAVHKVDDSFTTVTADISGGGMSIILPDSHMLKTGEQAEIWVVLQLKSGDYQYIHATAETIRLNDEGGVRTAALKFIAMHQNKQQSIIRYCFEKQLEARKKELT